MKQRWSSRRAFVALGLGLGVVLALGSGAALADDGGVGAVYVQTNAVPNEVRVFFRNAQGELTTGPVVPTGGLGSTVNPPFGLPLTGSQDSVVLTQDNRILLVTNAGSDTVSSFRVHPDGNIVLADQKPSGGDLPISVTATNTGGHRMLVYVLNENTQSVSGLWLDRDGTLTPIPGSTRSVTGAFSATIGFDATGRVLTVTTRDPYAPPAAMGSISTWTVDRASSLLGPEIVTLMTPENSGTGGPFGFDYTRRDHLIVAESGASSFAGSAASFDVSPRTATVTPISSGFLTGALTGWAKVTKDDRYAYLTNPGTADISGFTISHDGVLAPNGTTLSQGSPLDLDTSANGRFLYVLNTDISPTFDFGDSRVAGYRIEHDGSLTLIDVTPAGSGGTSGLAAY